MITGQKEKKNTASAERILRVKEIYAAILSLCRGVMPEGAAAEKIKNAATLFCAFVFALAKPIFSAYPFGIALLCAAESRLTYVFAGCAVGSLFAAESPAAYVISVSSVFLLRRLIFTKEGSRRQKKHAKAYRLDLPKSLVSEKSKCTDGIALRSSVSSGAALIAGVFRIVAGGFVFYDLFAAVFLAVACPLFTFLYTGFLSDKTENETLFEFGFGAMLFTLTVFLKPFEILSVSLALVFAAAATLLSAKSAGGLKSLALGLALGLAIDPLYCPMLGIIGLLSSVLYKYSAKLALGTVPAVGVIFAVFAGSVREGFGVLPELVASSILSLVFLRLGIMKRFADILSDKKKAKSAAQTESASAVSADGRIEALSKALTELSDTFRKLSRKAKIPVYDDYYQLCESACRRECMNCGMKNICSERGGAEREKLLLGIADQLYSRGRASKADIPDGGECRCYRLEKIVSNANAATARLLSATGKPSRTNTFVFDYGAVAKTLESALSEQKKDEAFSPVLSDRLRQTLRNSEFSAESLGVYGVRRHTVKATGVCMPQTKIRADRLHSLAENALGEALTEPQFELRDRSVDFTMRSRPTLRVRSVTRGLKRKGSEITGDSSRVMKTREDYCYAMLLDGMGSGRAAALTSRMGLMILSKMFESGNGRAAALGILTAFLLGGDEDRSTTLDLCEIDLITGQTVFLKCGAPPSFVIRRGKIYQLDCRTYPLGIAEGNGGRELSFSLMPGDRVVISSDGLPSSYEDKADLLALLEESQSDPLEETAEKLLRFGNGRNGGRDDVTVTLLELEGI